MYPSPTIRCTPAREYILGSATQQCICTYDVATVCISLCLYHFCLLLCCGPPQSFAVVQSWALHACPTTVPLKNIGLATVARLRSSVDTSTGVKPWNGEDGLVDIIRTTVERAFSSTPSRSTSGLLDSLIGEYGERSMYPKRPWPRPAIHVPGKWYCSEIMNC